VAHCKLSPSQESENEQIKNQIDSLFLFDNQGIVDKEFVPPEQTVNQTFYREVLERLRKRVARVRPGIART
jgi:trehalose-6-phosphatase